MVQLSLLKEADKDALGNSDRTPLYVAAIFFCEAAAL